MPSTQGRQSRCVRQALPHTEKNSTVTDVSKMDMDTRRRTCPHVTLQDIVRGLRKLGITDGDVVFAHSSLGAFGYVEEGADTVIDALLAAVGETGTLVLPAFTWGPFHAEPAVAFDLNNTPCETGRIPETFRKRPGVVRSPHICHSVAAFGPKAQEALGEGIRSFGTGSSFDRLYQLDSWNLLLGVTFSSCTALHSAEELVQVPYRGYRTFEGSTVVLADGTEVPSRSVEFLRNDGSSNDFEKVEAVFEQKRILKRCTIGPARCINARIRDIIDSAKRLLERDVRFLSAPHDRQARL